MISSILDAKGGAVVTAEAKMSVRDVARLLTDSRIGAVVIVEEGEPVGILSERDIVRATAREGALALDRSASAIMTPHLVTACRHDRIDDALAKMTDRRIRHLPVMEDDKLVGVVSIGDLVKAKIDAAEAEANQLKEYIATG